MDVRGVSVNLVAGLEAYVDEYGNVQVELSDELNEKLNKFEQMVEHFDVLKKSMLDVSARFEYETEQAIKSIEEFK